MDIKKIALLVGALMVAGITAFAARGMFASSTTPQAEAAPKVAGIEVLVPTRTLPVGTIIELGMLRYQPWPADMVDATYYKKGAVTPEQLTGMVVRYAAPAGQPITGASLVKPGDRGFLAAALGPGMRAVTVGVSATSGVAGFVFPGDRVDLVLTQDVSGSEGETLKVSETIVRNIRVLATDQKMVEEVDETTGKVNVRPSSNVTLEATPKIAEKIAVSQTIGTLSLSLRSIADNMSELERAIADGEIEAPKSDDPAAEKRLLAAIAARPNDSHTTITTGGEVSRFQRSTVPAKSSGPEEAEAKRIAAQLQIRTLRKQLAQQTPGSAITVRRGSTTADAGTTPSSAGGF